MSNEDDLNQNPKDGFDLIEYPCEYAFKAMAHSGDEIELELKNLVIGILGKDNVLNAKVSQSRTGKFVSVTITTQLHNREQLETVYQELSACKNVLMTL